MAERDDELTVTARVLPENRDVYESLLRMSELQGMSRDEVNSRLFNAGLVTWIERIKEGILEGPPGEPPQPPEEVGEEGEDGADGADGADGTD